MNEKLNNGWGYFFAPQRHPISIGKPLRSLACRVRTSVLGACGSAQTEYAHNWNSSVRFESPVEYCTRPIETHNSLFGE